MSAVEAPYFRGNRHNSFIVGNNALNIKGVLKHTAERI